MLILFIIILPIFTGYFFVSLRRLAYPLKITHEEIISLRPPFSLCLKWSTISIVKLRYYSTKKTGDDGWFELTLKTPQQKLIITSQIENFEKILNKSALEIENNDISVDEITKLNFNNFDLLW